MHSRFAFLPTILLLIVVGGCAESRKERSGKRDLQKQTAATEFEPDPVTVTTEVRGEVSSDALGLVSAPVLREVAEQCGIHHEYETGAAGDLFMYESIGGGVAWMDCDRDGLIDLFCVQAGRAVLPGNTKNTADSIFRQRPGSVFQSVGKLANVEETAYGQGVAVADFDNDGFDDIFVTNLESNELWHNCGDGTFLKVSSEACCESKRWSSSAAWGDPDRDGDLDLYVCNYLQYDPHDPLPCEKDGVAALCHPRQVEAWPDEYYVNNGDGSFAECALQSGLTGKGNKALGVAIVDLNADQWPDIYVANDTTANFYFLNNRDGTFTESSLRLGGGVNGVGAMQASMGIACGDYNRDGQADLFLTHFTGESNTLYENLGQVGVDDVSGRTGLYELTLPKLGFGAVMSDLDRNGFPELFVANGHIDENHADGDGYEQNAQLLTYNGKQWIDVSDASGNYFSRKMVGRGVALGDLDNDGDPDLAVVHQNAPLAVLENQSVPSAWLTVVPVPTSTNRSAIGVKASLKVADQEWTEFICGGTSFGSSHQHRLFFGVDSGPSETATLVVSWPSGLKSIVNDVQLNQLVNVHEPQESDE